MAFVVFKWCLLLLDLFWCIMLFWCLSVYCMWGLEFDCDLIGLV